jgi:DNA mismatch repair ATPase MutS
VKVTHELPQIKNYHFREDVIDGKMMFDYHLRPGPSPTTNALKIMQIAGLPVDWKRGARPHPFP